MRCGVFRPGRRISALAITATLLTVAAACGSDGSTSSGASAPTSTADAALTAQVPSAVRDKGALVLATDPSYAPNEFAGTDGRTITGMDIDLGRALAGALGLKIQPVKVKFASILPGLTSGRYDIGMSSFTDTKEREAQVDFVTYFSAGTSFMTRAQGGVTVTGLDDLCGHTVAVETGTTQLDDAKAQSARCTAAGKPAVTVNNYDDQSGANLALTSGRAEVSMADSPVAAYQAKLSGGKIRVVGSTYGAAPYGIAVPRTSGMAKPLLAAMRKIIADGTYTKILNTWGIADGAITDPRINGATG